MYLTSGLKHMKQKLKRVHTKISRKENIAIVRNFNNYISINDRTEKQSISNDTENLNSTINEFSLTYIYRTIPSKNMRIHIILKCAWNVHPDIPYPGP